MNMEIHNLAAIRKLAVLLCMERRLLRVAYAEGTSSQRKVQLLSTVHRASITTRDTFHCTLDSTDYPQYTGAGLGYIACNCGKLYRTDGLPGILQYTTHCHSCLGNSIHARYVWTPYDFPVWALNVAHAAAVILDTGATGDIQWLQETLPSLT